MRLFALVLALALAGCGDDTTTTTPLDMPLSPRDLSGPVSCGVDGVAMSCSAVSGNPNCSVCDLSGGTGHCAKVCLLVQPSCPTGQTCIEFVGGGDGGAAGNVAVEGSGCAPYGFCR